MAQSTSSSYVKKENLSTSTSSILSTSSISSSSKTVKQTITRSNITTKIKGLFSRKTSRPKRSFSQSELGKNMTQIPMVFHPKNSMQLLHNENSRHSHTEEDINNTINSSTSIETLSFEHKAANFEEYTRQLEDALTMLRNLKREEYESQTTLKILRFLENLIHQPKEWISGAKLKLSEMKFPEIAITLLNSYKEKGYLVRRIVFVHSILLYNSMSNFTDHEFDKEGLIRKQSADAGFIELACDILKDPSYLESLKKNYRIDSPEEIMQNDDFNNYQKIFYICDAALTILYNLANLPELKIHFRECNAINIIAEYTKLPSNTIQISFPETEENRECILCIEELRSIASTIRVTSCLLLPLIMNEDEDNILAANTSSVLPLLSGMIKKYDGKDPRYSGFSFIELVDGLSKLMVRGRAHEFVDQHLVELLLTILEKSSYDNSLLECVSNAILNASFDDNIQKFLNTDRTIHIIQSAQNKTQSQLVQKNCEAILWTLNRIPHKNSSTIDNACRLQGHIMISYNRSVTAMCLKIRDRLKALNYNVWLDVDNINGGVLESMAQAVENSSIVLICMNEQYKQSYYCRLEAEYATELRKPCIPCLMQPRFRPYGWLGIIKGAKIHVDFATLPFEQAFPLLIREIETIRKDAMTITSNINSLSTHSQQTNVGFISTNNTMKSVELPNEFLEFRNSNGAISDWSIDTVQQWLKYCGLSHLADVFTNIDGKLLCNLYNMKELAADAYYKFLDKYFDRVEVIEMSNLLKFDQELEGLFNNVT